MQVTAIGDIAALLGAAANGASLSIGRSLLMPPVRLPVWIYSFAVTGQMLPHQVDPVNAVNELRQIKPPSQVTWPKICMVTCSLCGRGVIACFHASGRSYRDKRWCWWRHWLA